MSDKNTKGRLSIKENGDANSYALLDESGNWLLSILHNGEKLTSVQRETMRRVAACWNACEGISTDELEEIASTGGMLGPREDVARIAKQRDELLEAMKTFVSATITDTGQIIGLMREDFDKARTAILKATGEKA